MTIYAHPSSNFLSQTCELHSKCNYMAYRSALAISLNNLAQLRPQTEKRDTPCLPEKIVGNYQPGPQCRVPTIEMHCVIPTLFIEDGPKLDRVL
jgi:hypothetical protein